MDKHRLEKAENAIIQLARREGVCVERIRTQMKLAMLSGLAHEDPVIRAYWQGVPHRDEIPTPEEIVLYLAEMAEKQRAQKRRPGDGD